MFGCGKVSLHRIRILRDPLMGIKPLAAWIRVSCPKASHHLIGPWEIFCLANYIRSYLCIIIDKHINLKKSYITNDWISILLNIHNTSDVRYYDFAFGTISIRSLATYMWPDLRKPGFLAQCNISRINNFNYSIHHTFRNNRFLITLSYISNIFIFVSFTATVENPPWSKYLMEDEHQKEIVNHIFGLSLHFDHHVCWVLFSLWFYFRRGWSTLLQM